jgi:hypothetical protein
MKFFKDKAGNVAVTFALALVPLCGLGGVAVDTAQLMGVRAQLQNEADQAALNGAVEGPDGDFARYRAIAHDRIQARRAMQNLNVTGSWSGPDYTVSISGTMNTALVHIMPGLSDTVNIRAEATARLHQPLLQYEPPLISELDPEAGDYNRIYVYCFDPDPNANKTTEERRTQRTAIQDNAGTHYSYAWPRCEEGETISFELYNVRFSRTAPARWDDASNDHGSWCHHRPAPCRFNYFTDTRMVNNVEQHSGLELNILETKLCDTYEECKPVSQGGVIPEGRNRTPNRETRACEPGKFMYYGWEDRPPGMEGPSDNWTQIAWTDNDFDDIRVIMECPQYDDQGERFVRLIR